MRPARWRPPTSRRWPPISRAPSTRSSEKSSRSCPSPDPASSGFNSRSPTPKPPPRSAHGRAGRAAAPHGQRRPVDGKTVFAGGLPAEAKFTDAKTGQLLAAAVGRAAGTSSLKAAAQVEWGDAQFAMDLFSKRAATNLYALTSGTATPAQLPVE